MSNRQYVTLMSGQVYHNHGGGMYRCLTSSGPDKAIVQNTVSGWTCTAHHVQMYEDGSIEWDYSTHGRFVPLPAPASAE